ncbi:MAG: hypothetical protein AAF552_03225 [Pseudomonadota bacterium]
MAEASEDTGNHTPAQRQTQAGIHEFIFGAPNAERETLLRFWAILGFEPVDEGRLGPEAAGLAYAHQQDLTSVRLRHRGCDTFNTGLVRLQFWDQLRNEGLEDTRPLVVGSRWMGLYTQDILQLRDSLTNSEQQRDWGLWVSPLVNAPLSHPPADVDFYRPFVGLRETLVFGRRFRLAFIQRAGFDRPGFGTFDDRLAFRNTEGSHANIVQAAGRFDSAFYKRVFGFETAPYGDAHDSGTEPTTIEALALRPGETFHIERTRAVDCPSGLLQIYSSYLAGDDRRDRSRPGCGNLCAYSVRVRDLDRLCAEVGDAGGVVSDRFEDEFGEASVCFDGPDGYAWVAVADVG